MYDKDLKKTYGDNPIFINKFPLGALGRGILAVNGGFTVIVHGGFITVNLRAGAFFSALGFYPVCPASDEYVVGSPLFRKAVVNLENGNKIVLEAPDNSPENRYIGAVQFDGKSYTHNFLRHSDLVKGAGVRFSMRPEPDYTRGTEPGDAPYSFSRE